MDVIHNPKSWLAGGIIIASVVTDLRSKKIPNQLLLVSLGITLLSILFLDGISGFWPTVASFGAAVVFTLPLYLLRALGAGDIKLLMVISLLLTWNDVFTMIFAAMAWGALLGIVRVVLSGNVKEFIMNLFKILKRDRPSPSTLTQVPFAVAILFGFLTQSVLTSLGVSWV